MKPQPSLKKTFWWMAILGGMTLWCFMGFVTSIFIDPPDILPGLFFTLLFGGGFVFACTKHLKVIEKREAWRQERLMAWYLKDLPWPED